MSSLTALTVCLALAGTALFVRSFWWGLQNHVNGPGLGEVLLKLLNAGNRDRALKLCNAIGSTSPYYLVVHGALELRIPVRDPHVGPAADYRSPVVERPFEIRVRESLWTLVRAASRTVDRHVLQALVGCILIGAAAILAALEALLSLQVALGAVLVTAVFAALNLRKRVRMRRDLAHLSELLEPWVLRDDAP